LNATKLNVVILYWNDDLGGLPEPKSAVNDEYQLYSLGEFRSDPNAVPALT
jgi:hypothetical protein